jgi:hypothetical protein
LNRFGSGSSSGFNRLGSSSNGRGNGGGDDEGKEGGTPTEEGKETDANGNRPEPYSLPESQQDQPANLQKR